VAIHETSTAPDVPGLPEKRPGLRYFLLRDDCADYAAAAIAEHADCLELHLVALRFGPHTVRALRGDLEELKAMARRLGKARIVGLRCETDGHADVRWQKFTRLFGFVNQRVYQAAELPLE
jgi:hypothetical protein